MRARSIWLKKFFLLILLFFSLFIVTSCDLLNNGNDNSNNNPPKEDVVVDYLDIYSLNDVHGTVEDLNGRGLARIGNYLLEQKQKNPDNTIILVAGDMFQGTAISNLTYGGVVVDVLNNIGIDAFTIGNHEFDWGDQKIIDFKNNSAQVQANFPFLGANIYRKSTNQRAEWVDDYVIIERGGLKIGIIGFLGDYQINSITAPYVENYKFEKPIPIVKRLAFELRTEHDVDIVIVNAHDGDSTNSSYDSINRNLSLLEGQYQIDAVINAHTHRVYARHIVRQNRANLPVVQAGGNGEYIGHIRLNIDPKTKKVTSSTVQTIRVNEDLSPNNPTILEIINHHMQEVKKTLDIDEVLVTAGEYIREDDFASWAVNVLHKYSEADFAVVNSGAFRTGFPIYQGSAITVRRVFQFMPFDNVVLTSKLTREQLIDLSNRSGLVFSSNFKPIMLENRLYTVATVDYLFYKNYYDFMYGLDPTSLDEYFRDYLIDELRSYKDQNMLWYTNNIN